MTQKKMANLRTSKSWKVKASKKLSHTTWQTSHARCITLGEKGSGAVWSRGVLVITNLGGHKWLLLKRKHFLVAKEKKDAWSVSGRKTNFSLRTHRKIVPDWCAISWQIDRFIKRKIEDTEHKVSTLKSVTNNNNLLFSLYKKWINKNKTKGREKNVEDLERLGGGMSLWKMILHYHRGQRHQRNIRERLKICVPWLGDFSSLFYGNFSCGSEAKDIWK